MSHSSRDDGDCNQLAPPQNGREVSVWNLQTHEGFSLESVSGPNHEDEEQEVSLASPRLEGTLSSLPARDPPSPLAFVHQRWNSIRGSPRVTSSALGSTTTSYISVSGRSRVTPASARPRDSRDNFRAVAATLVFTHNSSEHVRRSPPLDDTLPLPAVRQADGEVSICRPNMNNSSASSLSAASDEMPRPATDLQSSVKFYDGCSGAPTQEAEHLNLCFTRSSLLASRRFNVMREGSTPFSDVADAMCGAQSSEKVFGIGAHRGVDSEHAFRGGAIAAPGRELLLDCFRPGYNSSTRDVATGVVEYKYIEVQPIVGVRSEGDNLVEDEDNGCCCCRFPSCCTFFCSSCCCCSRSSHRKLVKGTDARVCLGQNPRTAELTGGGCIVKTWNFINVFSGDISLMSRVFCLLNFTAALSTIVAGGLHLLFTFDEQRSRVSDDSVCNGIVLLESFSPDMCFAFICFAMNSLVAVYLALHAVRCENAGSFFCHFLTVVLMVGCFVNYLFSRSSSTSSHSIPAWAIVVFSVNIGLLSTACCLYVPVSRTFAHYLCAKGTVREELLRRRRQWMCIMSCLQADVVTTLNSGVAALCLASGPIQVIGGAFLVVISTTASLLFIPMLKRRAQWFIVVFVFVAVATTGFNCYVASHGVYEYFITNALNVYEVSPCYTNLLQYCLSGDFTQLRHSHGLLRYGGGGTSYGHTNEIPFTTGLSREKYGPFNISTECCLDYGRCRLLDSARFYASGVIALLVVLVAIVRLVLVKLWIHATVEDGSDVYMIPLAWARNDTGKELGQPLRDAVK